MTRNSTFNLAPSIFFSQKDLKFNTSVQERERKERIYIVAMSVFDYTTIVEYLDAMATASKK